MKLSGHVVAVLKGGSASAVQDLQASGFAESQVLDARTMEEEVDPMGEESSGPVEHVVKAMRDHLSEETNYLKQYMEAAQAGQEVVAVKVGDREEAQAAGSLLAEKGAENIRYFGALAIVDLTPESNPSMRSDQRP
jgi:hypothetical protein